MVIEENRSYVIVLASDYSLVNFNEVLEESEYLRYSIDETKFIVKYEGSMPQSISSLAGASPEYNYSDILAEVQKPFWKDEEDEMLLSEDPT